MRGNGKLSGGVLVASLVVGLLGLPAPAAHAQSAAAQAVPAAGATVVTPRTADDFIHSIGVATHLTYGDTSYRDYPMIARRLQESGIKHIRDGWGTGSGYASDYVRDVLGPMGIGITMVQDPRLNATPVQLKDMIKKQLLPVVDGVESVNEPDTHGPGWAAKARNWTIQVSHAFRGDPATARIPVLGPSMADTLNRANHGAMGDLSPYVDFGNTHDYPGDAYQMTDRIVDLVKANVGVTAPGKPIQATETGFSNGTVRSPYPATPEAQAAVLLPRLYLEHFRRGITRTFSYELLDERPDQEFESRFGLLRYDGTPKPSFRALSTLTGLLADPGPAFTPTPLALGLSGTDAATRTQLLQKRDGTYWLALWQQSQVWDGTRVLDPAAVPLTLTLPSPVDATVYRLATGTAPQAAAAGVTSLSVASDTDVTLVRLAAPRTLAAPQTSDAVRQGPVVGPAPAAVQVAPVAVPPVTSAPSAPVLGPVAVASDPSAPTVAGPVAPAVVAVPAAGPAAPRPLGPYVPVTAPARGTVRPAYVSDRAWSSAKNGAGPAERDASNGSSRRGDGKALTIAGRRFAKGVGVHAPSALTIPVSGARTFQSSIGVDAAAGRRGSVVFQVWADGVKLYESPRLRGGQKARAVAVDVRGRRSLQLVVTGAGDGHRYDQADWAGAVLRP